MGGAIVASNDIEGLFLNPACLVFSKSPGVLFSFNKWLADTNQGLIAISIPAREYIIGYGFFYLDYGKIKETTREYPSGTGRDYSSDSLLAGLCVAREIGFAGIGGYVGFVREQIDDVKADGVLGGIGLVCQPIKRLSFGCSLSDVTFKKLTFIKEKGSLAKRLTIGVDYGKEGLPFFIEGDVFFLEDEKNGFGLGFEYILKEMLVLRVGYSSRLTSLGDGLSLGFGFLTDKLEIRYAFLPSSLESTHQLSIVFTLGEGLKKKSKCSDHFKI